MPSATFEWDEKKDAANRLKHGVAFETAQHAFEDSHRVIAVDVHHGVEETRFFCFGMVGEEVMTVRYTWRSGVIRIFGAGYWRKGRVIYERENQIHG
jgi:uncharacterized DUF497 family protein